MQRRGEPKSGVGETEFAIGPTKIITSQPRALALFIYEADIIYRESASREPDRRISFAAELIP